MFPSIIKSFLWGSEEEEQCSPVNDEGQFIIEQKDDWLFISEQGMVNVYDLLALP